MKLKKDLKFPQVFSITIGSMISSGIFILPSVAYAKSGPSIIVSYILAGFFAMLGSLSMVELTTAMPKAGGVYFFASRSLGALTGTLSGILMWLAIAMKAAFAVYGLSAVISHYTGINFIIIGTITTLFYTALNIKGAQEAAKLDTILITVIIIIMIPFAIMGYDKITPVNFHPFTIHGGFDDIFATTAFVFIAFGGIMNAANISEEMANPKRDIPKAIFTAIFIVLILYTVILITAVGVLPGKEFIGSINPIADAGRIILGRTGFVIITVTACFAFSSCANSGLMSASRYPLALSRDSLAPRFIGKLSKRFNTPVISILLTAAVMILVLPMELSTLVEGASTIIITSYILTDLAVIVLRCSRIQNYRPTFKVPFFPWLQILSMSAFSFLIYNMGMEAIKISAILMGISIVVYLFNIKKNKHKFALFHAFEHLKNKKITSFRLEHELKDILCERDNVVKDELDRIIENATVIDLPKPHTKEELFEFISYKFKKQVPLPEKEINRLFNEREMESSTAISDTLAIPHIILNNRNIFSIIIIRSKNGIYFSETFPEVKAILAIAASNDKRNLYLRTISAIAQIINNNDFETNWMNAVTRKNLKDIFLLGKRKRDSQQ
ncbi:MAG: amino acid permease [Victivallales bacterium]|nr:amino acid permease [Victivallales bacterium]MCF7888668.1 amino acid permease [Victivallales bacterium]